jgi:transcription termination/antitermination protein NusG
MCDSRWCVLHVTANHEKRVAQNLSARSLEHYLPLYSERSRWTDRWVVIERPLFTGYLFARITQQTRITILSTPGVIRLLGDRAHEAVSSEEIARIREGLAMGCLLRPHPVLEAGTAVRVRSGVFEGVEGVVAELRRRCKVVIALSGTDQWFSLEIDQHDIEVLRRPVIQLPIAAKPKLIGAHRQPLVIA